MEETTESVAKAHMGYARENLEKHRLKRQQQQIEEGASV